MRGVPVRPKYANGFTTNVLILTTALLMTGTPVVRASSGDGLAAFLVAGAAAIAVANAVPSGDQRPAAPGVGDQLKQWREWDAIRDLSSDGDRQQIREVNLTSDEDLFEKVRKSDRNEREKIFRYMMPTKQERFINFGIDKWNLTGSEEIFQEFLALSPKSRVGFLDVLSARNKKSVVKKYKAWLSTEEVQAVADHVNAYSDNEGREMFSKNSIGVTDKRKKELKELGIDPTIFGYGVPADNTNPLRR